MVQARSYILLSTNYSLVQAGRVPGTRHPGLGRQKEGAGNSNFPPAFGHSESHKITDKPLDFKNSYFFIYASFSSRPFQH